VRATDDSAGASLVPPSEPSVKPGIYATAVNIHNFHTRPVEFFKRAEEAPGGISGTPEDG